jgi:predicted HTH transcriptional regulator
VEQNNEETTPLRALADFERFRRSQKDISKGQIQTTENVLYEKAQGPRQRTREHGADMSLRDSLRSLSKNKEDRMQNIITILRKQSSATIKDFSAMATECSEKTIQRLLIEMVQSGVLKRNGSRRWSRYSIV